jgi:murein DD-endopeptidase MepM/ murein hydrolase activator NlpD
MRIPMRVPLCTPLRAALAAAFVALAIAAPVGPAAAATAKAAAHGKASKAAAPPRAAAAAAARKGGKPGAAGAAGKAAKARGPTVIHLASPPAALLPALSAAHVHTGCAGAQAEAALGFTTTQLDDWITTHPPAAGTATAVAVAPADAAPAGCRHFASIAPQGPRGAPTALALMPWAERPAADAPAATPPSILVVTRSGSTGEPDTRWVAVDPLPAGLRETWVPVAPTAAALEGVPAVLHTELLLLLRQLRKEAKAPDTALARVWLLAEDEGATMPALELVEPGTGQALASTVWMPRAEGGGAYISSNGIEVERMLWQSPVDHLRVSRGIGASSMLVKRRSVEQARKHGKNGKRATRIVVRTFQVKSQHVGIDFAAPTGTPVVAVADGEIEFAGPRGGYGNLVLVRHANDLSTYYAHLSAFGPGVQAGVPVRRGQTIGQVGSTGFSTGPHLHFEIRKGNRYIDPTRPDVQLPEWTLQPEEHASLLMRLLQLGTTRERSLAGLSQPQLGLGAVPSPSQPAAQQPGS